MKDDPMKIAFVSAVPFSILFGGGETQLLYTKDHLESLNVDVKLFDNWDRDFNCEILHFFGCNYWNYHIALLAKKRGIKIALSTISYSEKVSFGYRMWKYIDRFIPVATTYGLNRRFVKLADCLLPNSNAEADFLEKHFNAQRSKIQVVPNAADFRFSTADSNDFFNAFGLRDFVLCIGKIEPRKNQLLLAETLIDSGLQLVFIGDAISENLDYYNQFRKIVEQSKNIVHIKSLPYDSNLLASAYASCKVHVLLGTNETPGIVSLEASLAGANIVVADCKPVREYFGDHVIYCKSLSVEDIKEAIFRAYKKPKTENTRAYVMKNFNWNVVAEKTLSAYKKILKNSVDG
jgi:glycosyltransferase involved in cell wall biosynthesis